jgi:hypothetical protein
MYRIGSEIYIFYSKNIKKELHGRIATVTQITGYINHPSVLATIDDKEYHFNENEFRVWKY